MPALSSFARRVASLSVGPPPSLQNPTRPETPAVHRRNSAFVRSASSQSTSRHSLSFTTMLSPLTTPLSSRSVSVDRWSRASSSSSGSRGRVERQEGEEGDELPGYSEWEEVRPKTAASTSKDSLLVCREEETADVDTDGERLEERKEQLLDETEKNNRDQAEPAKSSLEDEDNHTEHTTAAGETDVEVAAVSAADREESDSSEQTVEWHKPALRFIETVTTQTTAAREEPDAVQREDEEKEQSSLDSHPTESTSAAPLAVSPPPAAPSSRQLEETLVSLVYLASKLHDEPTSLSDSQLDHLYSLALSCLAHLTSPSSITQLAAAFLPLRPASASSSDTALPICGDRAVVAVHTVPTSRQR